MLGHQNIGLATEQTPGLMSSQDKLKLDGLSGAFTYTQNSPSATWTIAHGLGAYPAVTIVDSAGTVVIGTVDYVDADTITVSFTAVFSGVAYLT